MINKQKIMQEKLFDIKPIRVPRPDKTTIDLLPVYVRMAELINEWCKEDMNQSEFEYFIEELQRNFDAFDLFHCDGYELARDLEKDMGFDSDRNLVDDMDCISDECRNCLNENIEKWAQECNITPKYSIGDEVKLKMDNVEYIGEIAEINLKRAFYVIFVEELGHVREGVGTHGVIKNFEEVEDDFFDKKHWAQ